MSQPAIELNRPSLVGKPVKKNPLYSEYYKNRVSRKTLIWGLVLTLCILPVTAIAAFNVIVALVVLLVLLVIMLVCYRPVFGFYLMIFTVVGGEIFPTGDPISEVTSRMLTNLNAIIRGFPISATPLEFLIVLTLAMGWFHASRERKSFWLKGFTSKVWLLFLGFIVFGFLYGVLRKGEFNIALWEVRSLVHAIIAFFLANHFLEDMKRWKVLSGVMIWAVVLLMIAQLVRFGTYGFSTEGVDSLNGFNHDSALFFDILFLYFFCQLSFGAWSRHRFWAGVLLVPSLLSILISGRRAAFASLVIGFGIYLFVLYIRKRKLFFVILICTTIVAIPYTAVFWNAKEGIWAMPIRAIRSQDALPGSRDYYSDLYRKVEKYDVHQTIIWNKFFGIGFGQKFITPIPLLDLGEGFTLQDYTPHANILWVWLKIGMGGFAVFWLVQCMSLFKVAQVAKYGRDGPEMSLVALAGSGIAVFLVFAYVDIALSGSRVTIIMATFAAIIDIYYRKLQPDLDKFGAKQLTELNRPTPKDYSEL